MSDGDWTTLPVREPTRQRVRDLRPEGVHSVDSFVNDALDAYEGKQELSEDRMREIVRDEVRMEALE